MKICIIAEGSYPYVTGGVSSWIQMLINNMKEHEFIIYAIGAKEEDRGNFKYKLPENVEIVYEIFLDSMLNSKGKHGKNYKLTDDELKNLKSLITGNDIDWNIIFSTVRKKKIKHLMDFFMSEDFYEIIKGTYFENHKTIPFTEYFWNIRSMLIPLFYILRSDLPKADIYHSVSTGYAGIIGSLAKFLYNKPFILTEHGIYTREREEELIKSSWVKGYFKNMWTQFFYSLSKCAYLSSDKVITLFGRNKEIEIEIGCDKDKIIIIPNGVNIDNFNNITTEKDTEKINIGAVVRIVPIKDIKTMIYSFSIVAQKINANFYIMGPLDENEEYYEECINLVKSLGVENIIFTGRINIKEYLGKMDVLVLSSISEGQPLAILEGLACKKPFVTTDVGCCKELLYGRDDSYGSAGYVVPVMDYEDIAKKIIILSKDEVLRKTMGINGFNRVSNIYTIDNFINEYKKLYRYYYSYFI